MLQCKGKGQANQSSGQTSETRQTSTFRKGGYLCPMGPLNLVSVTFELSPPLFLRGRRDFMMSVTGFKGYFTNKYFSNWAHMKARHLLSTYINKSYLPNPLHCRPSNCQEASSAPNALCDCVSRALSSEWSFRLLSLPLSFSPQSSPQLPLTRRAVLPKARTKTLKGGTTEVRHFWGMTACFNI